MQTYKISEVARHFHIAPSKIRHYESQGLLSSTRDPQNSYRTFDEADIKRLTAIMIYRSMGFALQDIKQLLANADSVEKQLYRQTKLIDEQMAALSQAKVVISTLLQSQNKSISDDFFRALDTLKKKEFQMKKINYDAISRLYDEVRSEDHEVLNALISAAQLNEQSWVLDVGCGTGNYTSALQHLTSAHICGVDPSQGMLEKARLKNPKIDFKQGGADSIPFEDSRFDLIYMTDVIHHVPDLAAMFYELSRVLKTKGKICICTQSHRQIENRYISKFFPETVQADKTRYPDIIDIILAAEENGLSYLSTDLLYEGHPVTLGSEYLKLVENKGYSMLHQISDEAFASGLAALKTALAGGPIQRQSAGESLVWFALG